jgi:hypothetical protein
MNASKTFFYCNNTGQNFRFRLDPGTYFVKFYDLSTGSSEGWELLELSASETFGLWKGRGVKVERV